MTANITEGIDGRTILYDVSGSTPASSTPGADKAPAHAAGADQPVYPVDNPILISKGSGFCVSYSVSYAPDAATQSAQAAAAEPKWQLLISQFGPCPGVKVPVGAAGVSPAALAAGYWANQGDNPLMQPTPRIRPGYGLAGETAYLETGGTTGQNFTDPTGAGTLGIAATGTFWVDWGDGTPRSGPFTTTGGPWPDGTITHVWTDAGRYTVTVYEEWKAVWHLAGLGGNLGGLQTMGSIPGFEVRQLVSIRNR